MNRIYVFILIIVFESCSLANNTITEEEFKSKYDFQKAIVETKSFYQNQWIMEFSHKNKTYIIRESIPTQSFTDKFEILFDTTKPDKNYLILWHKPVKPSNTKVLHTMGELTYIKKYKDKIAIEYKYTPIYTKKKSKKRFEYIPINDFSHLKSIYEGNKNVIIDLYYVPANKEDRFYIRPFINLKLTMGKQEQTTMKAPHQDLSSHYHNPFNKLMSMNYKNKYLQHL